MSHLAPLSPLIDAEEFRGQRFLQDFKEYANEIYTLDNEVGNIIRLFQPQRFEARFNKNVEPAKAKNNEFGHSSSFAVESIGSIHKTIISPEIPFQVGLMR